ncbi:ABC transporter permease [Vibrio cholerae]|nr:ABC transporter permease [Vibrio cholerae]
MHLLASILTMIAAFSINIRIMGRQSVTHLLRSPKSLSREACQEMQYDPFARYSGDV